MISSSDVLRIRSFRDLWIGQAVSQLGDALYYLIFLFMVDRITGDARIVGATGVAETLPFLLLSLHAGVIADQRDRRVIMLFADVASGLILLAFAVYIAFDPTPPAVILVGVGALLSVVNVFFAPAKEAAIPSLVPPNLLVRASALSMATQNVMPLIGIGLSGSALGALYALSPRYFFLSAILLNGLSFVVSALYIRRLPRLIPNAVPSVARSPVARAWHDLLDGLRYLCRQRVLWVMVLLNLLVQLAISPFMVVYVTVNRAWFGGGFGTLALCDFSFFVGMVIGSMAVGRMTIRRPGVAFVVGLAIVGLTVAAMAISHSAWLFAFWNLVAGIALPFAQIPMTAYVQAVVPDAYRGRVNAVSTMTSMGIQPLGIGLGGLLLSAIGPAWMLAAMGAGMSLAALGGLLDRTFRTTKMLA